MNKGNENVDYTGTVDSARDVIADTVSRLAGNTVDPDVVVADVYLAIAVAALSSVKRNYISKARGGQGDYGGAWPALSARTIANRKIGKKDLERPDVKEFNELKNKLKRVYKRRLLVSMPELEANTAAERLASGKAAKMLGISRISLLGSRDVEILVDSRRLFNSISPGKISGEGSSTTYAPPDSLGGNEQEIEYGEGRVSIETTVEYASEHNEGLPNRKPPLPKREFMPEDPPDVWVDEWAEVAAQALAVSIALRLQR